MKSLSFTLSIIAISFISCKKNSDSNIDVYVAGYENIGPNIDGAKYWKNGTAINLPNVNGTTQYSAQAKSIFVNGNDVYVAGYGYNGTIKIPKYWKNGNPLNLTDNSHEGEATSIIVTGNDVYIAGQVRSPLQFGGDGKYAAVYWKIPVGNNNYTLYNLLPITNLGAEANSITVDGNGLIYLAGYETNLSGIGVAKYWNINNNTSNNISTSPPSANANSIAVDGNGDIYIAGAVNNVATYWKNMGSNSLPNGYQAQSITISGSDIYIAGNYITPVSGITVAKYWKRTTTTTPTITENTVSPNGTQSSFATAIAVSGSDVYVAGQELNGTTTAARYWKNGVATNLNEGSTGSVATSIFIKKN